MRAVFWLVCNARLPLQRLLACPLSTIYPCSLQMVAGLLRAHGSAAGRDAARLTQELLPVLLDRAGDPNTRIAKGVVRLAGCEGEVPTCASPRAWYILLVVGGEVPMFALPRACCILLVVKGQWDLPHSAVQNHRCNAALSLMSADI